VPYLCQSSHSPAVTVVRRARCKKVFGNSRIETKKYLEISTSDQVHRGPNHSPAFFSYRGYPGFSQSAAFQLLPAMRSVLPAFPGIHPPAAMSDRLPWL